MSRIGIFGQISDINDHLFLSGAGVLKPEKLKANKITCIINATTEEPNAYLPGIDYMKIRIDDNPYAHLDHYFDMVADKIRSVKDRGGRTLVHCVAGVSRSASLCMIYLVKYERMTLRQAYHYVKSARPIIRPNVGFWKQMIDYERKLRGHATVSMIATNQADLTIPDVYANDFKRHMLNQMEAQPVKQTLNGNGIQALNKRRGLSSGTTTGRPATVSYRRSTTPNLVNSTHFAPFSGSGTRYSPPGSLFISPIPARKPRETTNNIFGNLYNSSRDVLFPAF